MIDLFDLTVCLPGQLIHETMARIDAKIQQKHFPKIFGKKTIINPLCPSALKAASNKVKSEQKEMRSLQVIMPLGLSREVSFTANGLLFFSSSS